MPAKQRFKIDPVARILFVARRTALRDIGESSKNTTENGYLSKLLLRIALQPSSIRKFL